MGCSEEEFAAWCDVRSGGERGDFLSRTMGWPVFLNVNLTWQEEYFLFSLRRMLDSPKIM